MAAKKNTAPGREPRAAGEAGGETNIAGSPGDALVQARYWYRMHKAHPSEVTSRGFWETAALLSRGQGGEARYLMSEAKRIRREVEKQQWKETVLMMRTPYVLAFLVAHEDGRPIVRGYVNRASALVKCPWCAKPERHPVTDADTQIIVYCEFYPDLDYGVRLQRLPLLIPAYIPTREPSR